MRPTSARERRLVAILLLVAAIALPWFAIVAPILDGFATRAERRDQLALRYAHNLRIIASIPRLRRYAEAQRAAVRAARIEARDAESGRLWLAARVQQAIEQAGGTFREGADGEGRGGWAKVRVAARMTTPQLVAALGRLQNDPPWIVIDSLSVTANDALATGQSSDMDVEIEASVPFSPTAAR